MSRWGEAEMVEESVDDLFDILGRYGVRVRRDIGRQADRVAGADATLDVDGHEVVVEVRGVVSDPGIGVQLRDLVRHAPVATALLIADRISAGARKALRAQGLNYFDRRGHLYLMLPSVKLDLDLAHRENRSQGPVQRAGPAPLSSTVAKEVALACLLEATEPHGVRATANRIGRSAQGPCCERSVERLASLRLSGDGMT